VLDIEPVVVAIVYHYKLDRLLKRCSHRYSWIQLSFIQSFYH